MAFVKRLAAVGLALISVAVLLMGAHRITGPQAWNGRPFSWGRLTGPATHDFGTRLSNQRLAVAENVIEGPEGGLPQVADAAADPFAERQSNTDTISAEKEIWQIAAEETRAVKEETGRATATPPLPLPLPARTEASPMDRLRLDPTSPFDGSKNPNRKNEAPAADPPHGESHVGRRSRGRRIIEKGLPDSSPEERELWHDVLKELPPNDVKELLRLREQFGRLPRTILESRPDAGPPRLLPSDPQALEPTLQPPSCSPAAVEHSDPERVIRSTLASIAQARQIIVNNIANLNTVGYKREAILFESGFGALSLPLLDDHSNSGDPSASMRLGAKLASTVRDTSQGKLRHTDRPLDLAIDGDGFFQLQGSDQTSQVFYTRCGRFTTDRLGRVVLRAGSRELLLLPCITIGSDTKELEIRTDGQFFKSGPESKSATPLGQIQTVRFTAPGELIPVGENLYRVREKVEPDIGTPDVAGRGRVRQGFLEESNVDLRKELDELHRIEELSQGLQAAARILHLTLPVTQGEASFPLHLQSDAPSHDLADEPR